MKKFNLLLLFVMMTALSSCTVIGDIFKAGAVVGILAVVVILGLIIWIVSMFRK
ncbi:phosphatidate cytidylyltransferase [Mucilaginibacter sp. AW1-3]